MVPVRSGSKNQFSLYHHHWKEKNQKARKTFVRIEREWSDKNKNKNKRKKNTKLPFWRRLMKMFGYKFFSHFCLHCFSPRVLWLLLVEIKKIYSISIIYRSIFHVLEMFVYTWKSTKCKTKMKQIWNRNLVVHFFMGFNAAQCSVCTTKKLC